MNERLRTLAELCNEQLSTLNEEIADIASRTPASGTVVGANNQVHEITEYPQKWHTMVNAREKWEVLHDAIQQLENLPSENLSSLNAVIGCLESYSRTPQDG